MKAVDYSNLIAFKRQEFKKGKQLDDHEYHSKAGSVHSKQNPLRSMYSKKVPKDILDLNDDLS